MAAQQETTGQRIKRRRRELGLTQQALAESAGLSAKTVLAIERGATTAPRVPTIRAIARALGCEVGDLL